MKKIGKISINPEKVIKNEELVNLRGGYGGPGCCMCTVVYYSGQQETLAACNGYTDCRDAERNLWSSIGGGAISIGCE